MIDCCLEELEEKPSVTLKELKNLIFQKFQVAVCPNTIRKHLLCECYTLKQLCHQKMAMNTPENIQKRKEFVLKFVEHQKAGALIVFFDETSYDLYTDCSKGRSKIGDRAIVQNASTKGENLHIQLAVHHQVGVVYISHHLGLLRMWNAASYAKNVADAAKSSDLYEREYQGKDIVLVFDNAPAHNQLELNVAFGCETLEELEDKVSWLKFLPLAPYSPMLNPCEGCFSSLKAKIKEKIRDRRAELLNFKEKGQVTKYRMDALIQVYQDIISENIITSALISQYWQNCMQNMGFAKQEQPMQLGA